MSRDVPAAPPFERYAARRPNDFVPQVVAQRAAACQPSVASHRARDAVTAIASDVVELECSEVSRDPLSWRGYRAQLRDAEAATGLAEAALIAEGTIADTRATLIALDFGFLGGSVGEATGHRISAAFAHARAHHQVIVSLVASGGARMQEGMKSLLQLQRIASARAEAGRAAIPYISVVRDPTMGGTWVALASSADVILGISGGRVAFAGDRVRCTQADDRSVFTTDCKQATGFIDATVDVGDVPAVLSTYVALLADAGGEALPCPPPPALDRESPASGWTAVKRARATGKGRALEYLNRYFTKMVPISGDRVGGRDPGMLCGFGQREGRTIAYAAQTGSANTAAGYRTATRLLRMADRLRFPVLALIDTPGAEDTAAAEHQGIGTAIGETMTAMTEISVPVTSVVIGEGGSGGALALAAPERLWMMPNSYFSVIAPEGAAAILHRTPDRAPEIAAQLHLGPQELVSLKIARGICGP